MLTKHQKFVLRFTLIFGLSLIMGINISANAQDVDDPNHKRVGIEIHVVKGSGITEQQIRDQIEKANEIWKCSFVFVVDSNHTYDPNTLYDPNRNDAGKINIWGLKTKPWGNPNVSGRDAWVIQLVPGDGTNSRIKPSTLAHELGHILGLGHDDAKKDGKYDPNNIMRPDNYREDGITKSCRRNDKGADPNAPGDANAPPELQEKARNAREDLCAQAAIEQGYGEEIYDNIRDVIAEFIDLVWTQVTQVWRWGQRYLKLHLTTMGLSFYDTSTLGFYIESDNNEFTGDPNEGLDYCISFNPVDEHISFARYDSNWVPLDANGINYKLTYAWEDANVPPVATGVTFTFPMTLLERREGNLISFRAFGESAAELDVAPDAGLMSITYSPHPGQAHSPSPADGAVDVDPNVVLSWTPGCLATSHDVYFGTGWDDVNSMTAPRATKSLGDESYVPGTLDLDTVYFWRIDEVNDPCTWKGDVWRFTTANYLVVDDMEAYNDDWVRIFFAWTDGYGWTNPPPGWPGNGTGSTVGYLSVPFCEQSIVHGGGQSMPYSYDNSGANEKAYYSEAAADINDLEIGPDWTAHGVKALTLYFYGDPNNDANDTEQMYVGLEDSSGASSYAEVSYGEDMNDIREEEWHQWDIRLQDFNDGGVELTDVNRVYIGFGDRYEHPVPGGSGRIYIDDIRLYLPRCISSLLKPIADLSSNCVVDVADIGIMALDWLETEQAMESPANLYDKEPPDEQVINSRDFAVLMEGWLDEKLWPPP